MATTSDTLAVETVQPLIPLPSPAGDTVAVGGQQTGRGPLALRCHRTDKGVVPDHEPEQPLAPVQCRADPASYGSNPGYPGKIAHQYTNGEGYGGGLPEGCPPFGKCCMDSADGLTPEQYAAACGIGAAVEGEPRANDVFTDDDRVMLAAVHELLLKTAPNQAAAAEPKPTKTARSQAKPAKKTRSQRAPKAGSSRAPRAGADGDKHD